MPDWWQPKPGLSWQWQLSEPPVDESIECDVYDIDLFDNDASVVARLHEKKRKVIGYISVGSWEDWRPDKNDFPAEVLGRDYEGWPGEKWLDIRRIDLLEPALCKRLDLIQAKGFDAVEPDNMEIHAQESGFPLTDEDRRHYVLWLADQAHRRGLAIGMKNAVEDLPYLIEAFDFAILEDYFVNDWAEKMLPFVRAGKAVFAAEYDDTGVDMRRACSRAKELGYSLIQKHRILTSYRIVCSDLK